MFRNYENALFSSDVEEFVIEQLSLGNKEVLNRYDWPYIFFNNRFRANVLCWIKAKKGQSFLQIGSDYGCLAQFFLEKGCVFDCVELSENSSKINRLRNKLVNLMNMEGIDRKYDFVILDEALYYCDDSKMLLDIAFSCLKDEGHLYILEHNRNSYLYLSGKKNEHSGEIFGHNSRFYSLMELEELVEGHRYRFYYPYPNIELCKEIFTDENINVLKPSSLDNSLESREAESFDREKFCIDMRNNGIMRFFVDSFLIDVSNSPCGPDYIKVWSNRSKECQLLLRLIIKKIRCISIHMIKKR